MRLDSARALKAQVSAHISTFNAVPQTPLALGIGRSAGNDGYRLAVRARKLSLQVVREIARLNTLAGGEIDFRVTGELVAASGSGSMVAQSSIRIGASVAHYGAAAGTLGFFAKRNGTIGIVSNNHVIALEDRGKAGDDILHPAPEDSGIRPDNVIASLDAPAPLLRVASNRVDCAFAELVATAGIEPSRLVGTTRLKDGVVDPSDGQFVAKIGRTTGYTRGRILAFELDNLVIRYAGGFSVRFNDQLEIEPDAGTFSRHGDSGSLVFDEDGYAVGLLFALADGRDLAYANPIRTVLSTLNVELVT